jgi:hypothetical protein
LGFAHTASLRAAVRATQEAVGERVTFTWIRLSRLQFDEEKSNKWAEEEIGDL